MPPVQEECDCNATGRAFFAVDEFDPTVDVRVTVPEPWHVYDLSMGADGYVECCTIGHAGPSCIVSPVPPGPNPDSGIVERYLFLASDEETFEPQNITIEIVGPDATCP